MLKTIILLHRWLGIAFALLFAMWFATGMVMHFVPFPSLTETERFAGLSIIDSAGVAIGPTEAVKASGIAQALRVRLIQRSDGPVYIVSGPELTKAVKAADGTDAAIQSADIARAIADRFARNARIADAHATSPDLAAYDQWSVPNGFDRYRPLYRVPLNDPAGTEIYIASNTGEVVLTTTRHARVWNFVGSVAHWIYPTVLRRDWALWDRVVWNGSLLAVIVAVLGAVLGVVRRRRRGRLGTPYRGWHAWHHILGLVATVFVLTWIVSGWLSMDHGRLFSRGQLTPAEAAVATASPDWNTLAAHWPPLSADVRELEWFAFDKQFYRRDRVALNRQVLFRGEAPVDPSGLLRTDDIQAMSAHLGNDCGTPQIVAADDAYAVTSSLPGAPVDRLICGDVWFDIDAAGGAVLQRLDTSRRAYRWAYTALHTLDFPILLRHPELRTALVLGLCGLGFVFSVTGIVIGWRRLRLSL